MEIFDTSIALVSWVKFKQQILNVIIFNLPTQWHFLLKRGSEPYTIKWDIGSRSAEITLNKTNSNITTYNIVQSTKDFLQH